MKTEPINCVLVAAGKYHDIDFARSELLKHLGVFEHIRTRVFEDYENVEAIKSAQLLISYTCDVLPSESTQLFLQDWLEQGGRWLALHGTNSILELMDDGLWHAPRIAPVFMQLLGSQFISHPTIAPYTVKNTAPDHPLVKGIKSFKVADELYHMELHEPIERLLECKCNEPSKGFAEGEEAVGIHPVLYRKAQQDGEIIYFTLGHCRGHYDMRPLMKYWPSVDRGPWDTPEYNEILVRSIKWLTR